MADKYVVRDIWVDVSGDVKYVVIDVWGFLTDETGPVTGFQIRVPYSQYVVMSEKELDTLIQQKIAENESAIEKSRKEAEQSMAETEAFKKIDAKYQKLLKKEYEAPKAVA